MSVIIVFIGRSQEPTLENNVDLWQDLPASLKILTLLLFPVKKNSFLKLNPVGQIMLTAAFMRAYFFCRFGCVCLLIFFLMVLTIYIITLP